MTSATWRPWSRRVASGVTEREEGETLDWKTLGNYVLLVGLFVAMVSMFNQVNGRLDTMRAENQRQHDAMNGRIDTFQADMNRRFDTMQAENQRQHDAMQEVLRVFEGRITRLEEKADIGPESAE